jgi:hypothetical protein
MTITNQTSSSSRFSNKFIFQSHRHASTSSLPDRPFRILGLQQIAVGSLSKAPLSNLWTNVFGLEKIGSFQSEKENVDEDILRLGKEGPWSVEVDLMVPLEEGRSPKVGTFYSDAFNYVC